MLVSQKLAIAAHLHVLLRRKTGRVTDTQWMAENADYALAIVHFAREQAVANDAPDLREWADKLEVAVLTPATQQQGRAPLVQSAMDLLKQRGAAPTGAAPGADAGRDEAGASEFRPTSGFADSEPEGGAPRPGAAVPRYVGGIR